MVKKSLKASSWVTPVFDFAEVEESVSSVKNSSNNLWVHEFPPSSKDELAVHKKKIGEVEAWVQQNLLGIKHKKILLLAGPPGTGKSATVRAIAQELHILLKEWRNPSVVKFEDSTIYDHDSSQSVKFSDFLLRGSKYNSVCQTKSNTAIPNGKSLVLIEELPNAFILDPLKFHAILRKFSFISNYGLVFIVSESGSDEKITRQLFPQEIQQELGITTILFNSVATTLQMQALNRIISLATKSYGISPSSVPSKDVLSTFIEGALGDLRSCINALQFSMQGASVDNTKSRTSRKPSRKGSNSSVRGSSQDSASSFNIGKKDSNLILFRSLGKILYCKREGNCVLEKLPKRLEPLERFPLLEDPENIFDQTASDASTLSLFLHHNCLPFFHHIEPYSKSLHYICDSDIIGSFWNGANSLETYSSSVCIRGMMFHLDSKSTKNTFRPLTKPKWFSSTKLARERTNKLKFFHKTFTVTDKEVAANVIPYLAKIGSFSSSITQQLCSEIGSFPLAGRTLLDTSDADMEGSLLPLGEPLPSIPGNPVIAAQHSPALEGEEEDFLIEEYED